MFSRDKLHWHDVVFGDGFFLVRSSLSRIWHCLHILVLFVLWKVKCRFVFESEPNSLFPFFSLWQDEICHQILAKGAMLIKDAQSLDPTTYSNFIPALVTLHKRLQCPFYIPFHFLFSLYVNIFCKYKKYFSEEKKNIT